MNAFVGHDVYDPTTGVLRSSSVDDIAAWFLDTNYDGRRLLRPPRLLHRRRRPLRQAPPRPPADISDEAWATVNATVSRPFPRPKTGKVAVKVIKHFGDEVMKVFAA